jgi:hypothetical protein
MAAKQWVLRAQGKAWRKAEPEADQNLKLRSRAPKISQGLRSPYEQNSEREFCLRCNGILLKLSKQHFLSVACGLDRQIRAAWKFKKAGVSALAFFSTYFLTSSNVFPISRVVGLPPGSSVVVLAL